MKATELVTSRANSRVPRRVPRRHLRNRSRLPSRSPYPPRATWKKPEQAAEIQSAWSVTTKQPVTTMVCLHARGVKGFSNAQYKSNLNTLAKEAVVVTSTRSVEIDASIVDFRSVLHKACLRKVRVVLRLFLFGQTRPSLVVYWTLTIDSSHAANFCRCFSSPGNFQVRVWMNAG